MRNLVRGFVWCLLHTYSGPHGEFGEGFWVMFVVYLQWPLWGICWGVWGGICYILLLTLRCLNGSFNKAFQIIFISILKEIELNLRNSAVDRITSLLAARFKVYNLITLYEEGDIFFLSLSECFPKWIVLFNGVWTKASGTLAHHKCEKAYKSSVTWRFHVNEVLYAVLFLHKIVSGELSSCTHPSNSVFAPCIEVIVNKL